MMVEVTQADKDRTAWALDPCPNSMTWETLIASHVHPDMLWRANRVAQAFATHRIQSTAALQSELDARAATIEALEKRVAELEAALHSAREVMHHAPYRNTEMKNMIARLDGEYLADDETRARQAGLRAMVAMDEELGLLKEPTQ
jgi:hypothetical protein